MAAGGTLATGTAAVGELGPPDPGICRTSEQKMLQPFKSKDQK